MTRTHFEDPMVVGAMAVVVAVHLAMALIRMIEGGDPFGYLIATVLGVGLLYRVI